MGDSCSFSLGDHEDGTSERRVGEANRRLALVAIREALGPDFPARWVYERTSKGDFAGREAAVDVFNVPVKMQRELLRRTREAREIAKGLVGSSCLLIFHTPEATAAHYADVVDRTEGPG